MTRSSQKIGNPSAWQRLFTVNGHWIQGEKIQGRGRVEGHMDVHDTAVWEKPNRCSEHRNR